MKKKQNINKGKKSLKIFWHKQRKKRDIQKLHDANLDVLKDIKQEVESKQEKYIIL